MGCFGESSKRIIVSKPLSLNLSAIEIPIKGNVWEGKEEEGEWEDKIKQYQLINHIEEINFDDLLGFWLIPICIPNILFVPKPSIEPDNGK